jgi:alpha-beta hydrolase superfamily lysophospholipase
MALDNPPGYQGVVLSAPAFRGAWDIPGWKVWLGRQLSQIMPATLLASGLPPKDLSHDQAIVEAYVADPLVHDKASARMATEIFRAQEEVIARVHEIKLPILILHATDDHIISVAESRAAFERIGSPDKTWLEYNGFYHEIFNEIEKERPIRDMINWMDAHL